MEPITFKPVFKDYIWGGSRLSELLGKATGPGVWAESWEIVDHIHGQSVVDGGPFDGSTLAELLNRHGAELLGKDVHQQINAPNVPFQLRGRFPLLLKFLDANRVLSVQVHPDDKMGATLTPPDFGKTEAWYVVDAKPDAKIYAGLKPGITESDLRTAVDVGKTEEVLHSFTPTAGDCIFVKAGTIHAIGAGLLICEIQQASNTTFRLFDWNRLGNDGQPRPLHIEQGIAATNFSIGPISPHPPETQDDERYETLVACDKFVLKRRTIVPSEKPATTIGGDGRFRILAVVSGEISILGDNNSTLNVGSSVLIPASCPEIQVGASNKSIVLEIHLP